MAGQNSETVGHGAPRKRINKLLGNKLSDDDKAGVPIRYCYVAIPSVGCLVLGSRCSDGGGSNQEIQYHQAILQFWGTSLVMALSYQNAPMYRFDHR
jgi:hypothetical protein